jgi:GDP-4-dehydro-6-deoxy-D-mannose reductase
MRVLVTGAAGFTGTRMMEFLGAQGIEPTGMIRRQTFGLGKSSYVTGDLLDPPSLRDALEEHRPDAIIHLAGLTRGSSDALYAANVTGTKNLLDTAITVNPACRILVVSSSAVYGNAGNAPIPETTLLRPVNDYGKSKVAQEELSLQYNSSGIAAISVARPFNLAGPGQSDNFLCGRIIKQVIEIEQKEKNTLDLLEISTERDLIDVRDVVRGYWALISHPGFRSDCVGKPFNLGSGKAYRISEIIEIVEEITGKHYKIRLSDDQQKVAIPTQQSDNSRITSLTGWKPEIAIRETLRDMLDYERNKKR